MKDFTALIIMDGFGMAPPSEGNAISHETAPHIFQLMRDYPSTQLGASGLAVGLPEGQMGNSEVGHLNI
ncbi:MAG: 2,3-bisphosphoglycerate-independent phosphoglycerate mutase, partial [Eubacteriales bacterium]